MNMSVGDYLDCLNCCRKAQPGSGWHNSLFGGSGLYKNRENLLTTKHACMHSFLSALHRCDVTSYFKSLLPLTSPAIIECSQKL